MLVNTGRIAALDYLLDIAVTSITIRLYQNDFAGGNAAATMASLTEADFAGYAAKDAVEFPAAAINGDGAGESLSDTLTWTNTAPSGSQTIYGIYATVFDPVSEEEVLFWYDRFAASITLAAAGQVVEKKVKFLDTNYAP